MCAQQTDSVQIYESVPSPLYVQGPLEEFYRQRNPKLQTQQSIIACTLTRSLKKEWYHRSLWSSFMFLTSLSRIILKNFDLLPNQIEVARYHPDVSAIHIGLDRMDGIPVYALQNPAVFVSDEYELVSYKDSFQATDAFVLRDSSQYRFLDIPKDVMIQRLKELPPTEFLSNLEILAFCVHTFFLVTFHRTSAWPFLVLSILAWIYMLIQVLQGPRRQEYLLQEFQFMNIPKMIHALMNTSPVSRMLWSLPMCMILGITEPSLCNPHMQSTYFMRSFLDDEESSQTMPQITGKCIVFAHHGPGFDIAKLFRFVSAKYSSYRIITQEAGTHFRSFVQNTFQSWLFNGRLLPREHRAKIKNEEANITDRYASLYTFIRKIQQDDDVPVIVLPDRTSAQSSADTSFFYRIGGTVCAQAIGMPLQNFFDAWPSFVGGPCSRTRTQMTQVSYENLLQLSPIPRLSRHADLYEFIDWQSTHRYEIGRITHEIENFHHAFLKNDASQCGQSSVDPIINRCQIHVDKRDYESRTTQMCSG